MLIGVSSQPVRIRGAWHVALDLVVEVADLVAWGSVSELQTVLEIGGSECSIRVGGVVEDHGMVEHLVTTPCGSPHAHPGSPSENSAL
jgi:hypothetical protein